MRNSIGSFERSALVSGFASDARNPKSSMNRTSARSATIAGLVTVAALVAWQLATRRTRRPAPLRGADAITIDYPNEGALFPPELPAPTWLWRDTHDKLASWQINIAFSDGAAAIQVESTGERMRIGESDPRCISPTNQPPALTKPRGVLCRLEKVRTARRTSRILLAPSHWSHLAKEYGAPRRGTIARDSHPGSL